MIIVTVNNFLRYLHHALPVIQSGFDSSAHLKPLSIHATKKDKIMLTNIFHSKINCTRISKLNMQLCSVKQLAIPWNLIQTVNLFLTIFWLKALISLSWKAVTISTCVVCVKKDIFLKAASTLLFFQHFWNQRNVYF